MKTYKGDFEKLLIWIKGDFFTDIQVLKVVAQLLLLMFGLSN